MHPEFRYWAIVLGSSLMSLLCAIPNAFNTISDKFQANTHTSSGYVALVSGFGVAGLQLTLIGGLILDKYGPVVASVCGGVFVVCFGLAMSWTYSPAGLLIEFFMFSLGGGCSFLAALSTAIAIGRPLGIGLVSLAMSLSITFTVGITKTYSNMHGSCKDEPHCWRRYMQVYAVCCAVLYTVGTLALALYRRPPAQDSSRLLSTDHGSVVSNAGVGLEAVVDKEFATNEEPLLTQPGFTGNARSVSTGSKSTMSRPGTTLPGGRSVSTPAPVSFLTLDEKGGPLDGGILSTDDSVEQPLLPARLLSTGAVDILRVRVSFVQSLVVFKSFFFWSLFYGYLCGIACGILIITSAKQEWQEFNEDPAKNSWSQDITVAFSVCSASTNVISPLLSTFLHDRGLLSRAKYLIVVLSASATIFMILGIMVTAHDRKSQSDAERGFFAALMACAGVGFGTFLTVFPTLLGDVFGHVNFGTFMSYMQLGAAAFAIIVPIVADAVKSATGSYKAMYFAMMAMLALAAVGMTWSTRSLPPLTKKVTSRSDFQAPGQDSQEKITVQSY